MTLSTVLDRPARAQLPAWAKPLTRPARYKVLYGGRGSGKTWTTATLLVLRAAERPLRVACVREYQKSIHESAKRTIEDSIGRLGLGAHFEVQRDYIRGRNGSLFFFRGMSTSTEEAIRGWEAVDAVWVEEAQRMSQRSREILYPTIRKPGSELWFTFNPRYRSDPVWRDFCASSGRLENAVVLKVNHADNPWFPAELEAERLICQRDEPDRYAHIWLGECDDEGDARKVLPYAMLQACVDAWDRRGDTKGMLHAGLDVADTGADLNALVARQGPCMLHVESWHGSSLGDTARRADRWCREHGASVLHYDAGGVGAGVRSHLRDMGQRPYSARPVNFGGKVTGEKTQYSRGATNADFFSRRNAQLAWALRLRAMMTRRFMDGEDVNPEYCLFIDPKIPRLESFLAELGQPEWEEDASGRVKIEKCPDGAPSPDLYDAAILAFGVDSRYGLRLR